MSGRPHTGEITFAVGCAAIIGLGFGDAPPAYAWSKHHLLMPYVANALGDFERKRFAEPAPAPCEDTDLAIYAALAQELGLQPAITLPPSSSNRCGPGMAQGPNDVPLALLRIGDWVDDPDRGMDQDLPDSLDPTAERRYMGGSYGPTSQGFRHMYFGGWKVSAPIASFQIPLRALGQSPERVELFSQRAKTFRKNGQMIWSARTLAWAMHFIQDLAQPFHSVQIPHLSMIPWSALFDSNMGKPGQGFFVRLVTESTRTVANYHFAYERWTAKQMRSEDNPFNPCLNDPARWTTVHWDPGAESPRELALEVAKQSLKLGRRLGRAEMGFFGLSLKWPGVNLPQGHGEPDYDLLDRDPSRAGARKELVEVTCQALANAVEGSRLLAAWLIKG